MLLTRTVPVTFSVAGLVRAAALGPLQARRERLPRPGLGTHRAWPCLARAPGQCPPDTDLRPEATGRC